MLALFPRPFPPKVNQNMQPINHNVVSRQTLDYFFNLNVPCKTSSAI